MKSIKRLSKIVNKILTVRLDFQNIIAWRTLVTAVVCDNSIIQQAFSIITLTIDFLPFKVSSFDYFEAI